MKSDLNKNGQIVLHSEVSPSEMRKDSLAEVIHILARLVLKPAVVHRAGRGGYVVDSPEQDIHEHEEVDLSLNSFEILTMKEKP